VISWLWFIKLLIQQNIPDHLPQGDPLRCCSARRNEPNVHKVEMRDNGERWHGAQLSLIIAGHWQYYRAKVREPAASADHVCYEARRCALGGAICEKPFICNIFCTPQCSATMQQDRKAFAPSPRAATTPLHKPMDCA